MTQGPTDAPVHLGRYELLGEIASGGMATVFLARSSGAGGFTRLVAIKRLHPHLEAEEEFVRMFLDEARLAARIRHPNQLAREAQKAGERLPVPVAIRIALDTLAGLHAAHELRDENDVFLHVPAPSRRARFRLRRGRPGDAGPPETARALRP
jgi:serine/threonine-protein kinase